MTQARSKVTANSFGAMKKKGEKIVWLTAYDFYTARALDRAGVDGILVGDSVNMVLYGKSDTLSATMDMMIRHTDAVSRGAQMALVIGDMPFGSYQASDAEAVANACRFLAEGGAGGVKLEGGIEMAGRIKRITECGIPVFGHIGLTPQSINKFGGYKVQGKTDAGKNYLLESAQALEEAGCFSIVLEAMKNDITETISKTLAIPTIGIGAGAGCDGQIIVINDILGMNDDFVPKFVRQYLKQGELIQEAAAKFTDDVRKGKYPTDSESYG
ncbi:MAG: 3-methyl-2-oxobutanoate hydroxymethyltransferase [Candidatus Zixiibacteriota bacterium]